MLLLINSLWIFICFMCIIAGIILGAKRQKETPPSPKISKEEEQKREKEERELKNFWTYNGDEQSR